MIEKYSNPKLGKKGAQVVDTFKQCESFAALEKVLLAEQQIWNSKKRLWNGKPQELFHRVCKTLDGHQTILSAIPDNNEYTSVFCAALKTVIQVCKPLNDPSDPLVESYA